MDYLREQQREEQRQPTQPQRQPQGFGWLLDNNNSVSSSSDALFVGHPSNQASSQYSHSLYNHPSNNHNFNPLHQSQSPFLSDSHSRQLPPLQTLHGHHLHLHDRDDDDSGSGGMIRPNHSRSNTRRSDSTNPLETKRRRFNSDVDVSINFQRSVEEQAEEDIDVGGWLNNPSPEGLDQENQEQMMSTRSSQIKNQNHNHTFIRQENRSEEVDAILDVGLEIDQDQELQNQPPQPQTNPKKKRKRPPKEKAKQDLDGEVEVNHQYPVDLKPTTTIEEDEPLYVNAKQYSRILARRNARHEKEVEKEEIWRSMWQDKIKEICDTTLRHKLQKDGNGGEKSYDKEILSEALKIAIDEGWENWSEYGPKVKKGKGKGEEIVMETRIGEDGKPYLYESRHAHAMRRPRGKGGRFLTAQEIEELKSKGEGEISGGSSNPTHNQEISSNFNLQGDEDGNVWNLKL